MSSGNRRGKGLRAGSRRRPIRLVDLDENRVGIVRRERRPRLAERVQMFGGSIEPRLARVAALPARRSVHACKGKRLDRPERRRHGGVGSAVQEHPLIGTMSVNQPTVPLGDPGADRPLRRGADSALADSGSRA